MKKVLVAALAATAVAIVPATASAAPGTDIQSACGAPFGALVASGKSTGNAVHANYAGGANAFSAPAVLAVHCGAS
jgi:hypothetical protein